ncbi:MAG: hypothetical protein HC857_05895 [Synechococcales cyanobacterium RU_4_20]|nr:hypothetical protein [Synechococcales cyanobacterium RU_4_20]
MGFNALYSDTQAGGTAQLPEPTPEVWEAIASFYNRQRTSQLTQPAPSLDATQVERNLRKMAKWIHGYFIPRSAL